MEGRPQVSGVREWIVVVQHDELGDGVKQECEDPLARRTRVGEPQMVDSGAKQNRVQAGMLQAEPHVRSCPRAHEIALHLSGVGRCAGQRALKRGGQPCEAPLNDRGKERLFCGEVCVDCGRRDADRARDAAKAESLDGASVGKQSVGGFDDVGAQSIALAVAVSSTSGRRGGRG